MKRKRTRELSVTLYFHVDNSTVLEEVETNLWRATDAIRNLLIAEGREWSVVKYYFYRPDRTMSDGEIRNS